MTKDKNTPVILIAASGSGGHLVPAKLITEAVIRLGAEVQFIGSGRPLEKEVFSEHSIKMHAISVKGVSNRGLRGTVSFFISLPKAIIQTYKIIKHSKAKAVIGVGGYASVIPVILGRILGLKTWIHEAEIFPGNANKLLAHFTDKISLAFPETIFKNLFGSKINNVVFTGHPLRPDVSQLAGTFPECDKPRKLLVLGGSQGAKALDDAVFSFASTLKELGIELWHQCRMEAKESLEEGYRRLDYKCKVTPFIQQLGEAYKWADIIIARAGAGTIMELGVVNRPTILVPFPHAQGKHQHKNAKTLVDCGKAIMVDEEVGEDFNTRLKTALIALMEKDTYQTMLTLPSPDRPLDAANTIASGIFELIKNRS